MRLIVPDRRLWIPDGRRVRSAAWGDVLAGRGLMTRRRCCCSSGGSGYPCGSCPIPKENLTVSWTNLILGPGSDTLIFNGSNQWSTTDCPEQLIMELLCTSNQVEFRVYYFVSGSCPTGQSQYCSTIRSDPFKLIQMSITCGSSFTSLTCDVTSASCPNLASNGYTSFTVSA